MKEMPCFRVQCLTVYLVIHSYQGINLTESCTRKEGRTGMEMFSIVGYQRRCIPDMIEDLLWKIYIIVIFLQCHSRVDRIFI